MMAGKKPPVAKPAAAEPETEVEVEIDPTFAWRLEQLERGGFQHFPAFRIAMTNGDYRKAIRMLAAGASEDVIVNAFID